MPSLTLIKDETRRNKYRDLDFSQWLVSLGKRFSLLVSTGWVVGSLSLVIGWVSKLVLDYKIPVPALPTQDPGLVFQIVVIVNFLVIFAVLLFPARGPKVFRFNEGEPDLPDGGRKESVIRAMCGYDDHEDWVKAKSIAVTVLRQFETVWMFLWVFWLLLAVSLVTQAISSSDPSSSYFVNPLFLSVARTLSSNCNTLMMVFCYEILAQPTTLGVAALNRPEVNWSRWIAIAIFFTCIQVFLVVRFHQLGTTFEWISGLGSATAFALFVGRLDSRYLNPPTWFLVLMYAYVAIQPLFVFLGDATTHPLIKALIINVALLFKCLLYLYMVWLFQSGRFLFYFVRVARVYQLVGDDWKHFSESLDRRRQ